MLAKIIAEFLISEVSKDQTEIILKSLTRLELLKNKIPQLIREEKYKSVIQLCEFLAHVDSILKICNKK